MALNDGQMTVQTNTYKHEVNVATKIGKKTNTYMREREREMITCCCNKTPMAQVRLG